MKAIKENQGEHKKREFCPLGALPLAGKTGASFRQSRRELRTLKESLGEFCLVGGKNL
jgi:hypothetical protein